MLIFYSEFVLYWWKYYCHCYYLCSWYYYVQVPKNHILTIIRFFLQLCICILQLSKFILELLMTSTDRKIWGLWKMKRHLPQMYTVRTVFFLDQLRNCLGNKYEINGKSILCRIVKHITNTIARGLLMWKSPHPRRESDFRILLWTT